MHKNKNNEQDLFKNLLVKMLDLGHNYPAWPAQLGIRNQITLWGYFLSLDLFILVQTPFFLSTNGIAGLYGRYVFPFIRNILWELTYSTPVYLGSDKDTKSK